VRWLVAAVLALLTPQGNYVLEFQLTSPASADVSTCQVYLPGQPRLTVPASPPAGQVFVYAPADECAALNATELCAVCVSDTTGLESVESCSPIPLASIQAAKTQLAAGCATPPPPPPPPPPAGCATGSPVVEVSGLPDTILYTPSCGASSCEGRVYSPTTLVVQVDDPGLTGVVDLTGADLAQLRLGTVAAVKCFDPTGLVIPQTRLDFDFAAALTPKPQPPPPPPTQAPEPIPLPTGQITVTPGPVLVFP